MFSSWKSVDNIRLFLPVLYERFLAGLCLLQLFACFVFSLSGKLEELVGAFLRHLVVVGLLLRRLLLVLLLFILLGVLLILRALSLLPSF